MLYYHGMRHSKNLDYLLLSIERNTDECIEWPFSRHEQGYGQVSINGKTRRVHIIAFEIKYYKPKVGEFICHTCNNPPCFNPRHLYAGSHLTNVDDCIRYRSYKSVLNEDTVRAVRLQYANKEKTISGIARNLGVARMTIYNAIHGRTWKHIV